MGHCRPRHFSVSPRRHQALLHMMGIPRHSTEMPAGTKTTPHDVGFPFSQITSSRILADKPVNFRSPYNTLWRKTKKNQVVAIKATAGLCVAPNCNGTIAFRNSIGDRTIFQSEKPRYAPQSFILWSDLNSNFSTGWLIDRNSARSGAQHYILVGPNSWSRSSPDSPLFRPSRL
jgi:hypothetical protein